MKCKCSIRLRLRNADHLDKNSRFVAVVSIWVLQCGVGYDKLKKVEQQNEKSSNLDEILKPIVEALGVGEKIEFKPDPIPDRKRIYDKSLNIIKAEKPIDREKLESVLRDINHNYVLRDHWVNEDGHSANKITGKIGDNVTFDGVWNTINKYVGEYTDHAGINLQTKGKKLSKLNVEYNFGKSALRPHAHEFLPHRQQFAALDNITEIAVTSPAWEKSNGLVTESGEAPKTVRVFHAPDETAHEVVDKLYDTVERSKSVTAVAKKLTEAKLPVAAAEGLVDLIYALAEKSKTNEQDNGREM